LILFSPAHWADRAVPLAQAFWWVDVALALCSAWLVPHCMFTRQRHELTAMTAVWLLPLVAAEVAAASGALLAAHLPVGSQSTRIIVLSYALWGASVFPALGVLVILFLRMALHRIPGSEMAATSWLSLGPIGTGALALLLLGEQAQRVFAGSQFESIGEAAKDFGVIGGLMLWGYGLWWLGIAVLTTCRQASDSLRFNMGWWAFTFPLGVYSLATLGLGRALSMGFFQIVGTSLGILLLGAWVLVGWRTLGGVIGGQLFVAPCLSTPAVQEYEGAGSR
jgi:C4-dicarboxylate transporter/malic acid transport protein